MATTEMGEIVVDIHACHIGASLRNRSQFWKEPPRFLQWPKITRNRPKEKLSPNWAVDTSPMTDTPTMISEIVMDVCRFAASF